MGGGIPIVDGKVKMAVIQMERIAEGDVQIMTDDGLVIDFDSRFFIPDDATATIHQCDDELWCNGDETCVDGVCEEGDDPCPDDGIFCNGGMKVVKKMEAGPVIVPTAVIPVYRISGVMKMRVNV